MTSIWQIPTYLGEQTARFLNWYSRQPLTFIGTTGSIMLMTQSLLQCNPSNGFYNEWGCRWSTHPIPNGMMFLFIGAGILQKALRLDPASLSVRVIVQIRNPGRAGVDLRPIQIQVR